MRRLMLLAALALHAVAAPPQRIVSTAPSFTESLFALGAGDRVIAVSTYCHFPSTVEKLPRVGSYLRPNIEVIARLRPDLVLVHAEQQQAIAQLAKLNIPALALSNTSLADTLIAIGQIGEAIGAPQQAAALERAIRSKLSAVKQRVAGKPQRALVFVVGRTPGRLEGMIAVGKGSFLNELIETAGGRNIFFDSPVTYPRISMEAVLRLDPDVIVDMGDMAQTVSVTEQHKRDVVSMWHSQPGLRAVTNRKVFAVAADIFVVPGPRVAEAAEAFARMLHE